MSKKDINMVKFLKPKLKEKEKMDKEWKPWSGQSILGKAVLEAGSSDCKLIAAARLFGRGIIR